MYSTNVCFDNTAERVFRFPTQLNNILLMTTMFVLNNEISYKSNVV